MRPNPDWLVDEPYHDVDLGVLKTGKEAQINLIDRRPAGGGDEYRRPAGGGDEYRRPVGGEADGVLIARKRYLPREVKTKGALEALGVQQASAFRNDVQYREGRQFRKSRDRRAVERMSTYGKRLLQDRWTGHEHDVMGRLWQAGMSVPYPISYGDDVFDLEYIGDAQGAAPQLHAARLDRAELVEAFDQLRRGLDQLARAGIAHGDLSAYNLLWWDDRLWFIDFPQAVDVAANPQGLNFMHADVVNVCTWFGRRGVVVDPEGLFAELLVLV